MIALRPLLRLRTVLQVALLLACAALAGCSFIIDVDRDQCSRDSDCTTGGLSGTCSDGVCIALAAESPDQCDGGQCGMSPDAGGQPPPTDDSCVGSMRCDDGQICFKDQCVAERQVERFVCEKPVPPVVDTVHFTMPVVEFVTAKPPKGMVVKACRSNDVSCEDPEAMFVDAEEPTGLVEMDLPYKFSGYLEVRSPDTLTGLWYFTEPLLEPTVAKPLMAVSPDTLSILAAVTGFETERSKGLVILEAFDCSKASVGGIHFEESKRDGIPFFIIDGIPNTESTVTVFDEKENIAAGGFVNATPGFTVFTARVGRGGPMIAEFNANVRANSVTYVDFHP